MVKSIASFLLRRKPHPCLQRMITPGQALMASVVVLAVALWPLLTIPFGYPANSFGHFVFVLCATLSVFAPASLCLATFIDIVRRGADIRSIAAFVFSLAGVAAIAVFIQLWLQEYDRAA